MPIPSRLPSHQFLIPDGKYADLEVTCGTGIVKVHKVVVCGMSPVLDNITKPGTKVRFQFYLMAAMSTILIYLFSVYTGQEKPIAYLRP